MIVVPAPGVGENARLEVGSKPISVLIVDSQPLFLAALANLLEGPPLGSRVLATTRSDDGVELARAGGIDLVFCELRAKPVSGIDVVQALGEEDPPIRVILLCEEGIDQAEFTAALAVKAAGIFTKNSGLDEFLVGVRAVIAGHVSIGATLMAAVIEQISYSHPADGRRPDNRLSATEIEILTMVGQAHSIPTIAATRGISNKTVRNHLAKIYRKLDLHGRTEAMLWAARMGLTGT